MGEREGELARRNAVWVAQLLGDVALREEEWDPEGPSGLTGGGNAELLLRIGTLLLDSWSTDAEVRELLRPLFVTAVPAQRALLALGDIDTWSTGGHDAREWWGMAAQGADHELAALAAWRAARADLRGRRGRDTRLLLHQAAEGGFVEAQEALDRLEGCVDDAAAREDRALRAALGRAEERLREHDLLGAQYVVDRLDLSSAASELHDWTSSIRGEVAFRRGVLASAKVWFGRTRHDEGERGAHARLRLAQIAIADGDREEARRRLAALAADAGPDADQARLLLELHGDLVEEDDTDDG